MKPGSKPVQRLVLSAVMVAALMLLLLIATGRVSIVVTSGSSMEPTISVDDMSVLRAQSQYDIGDVLAYSNPDVGTVLHRVIEIDDSGAVRRYVLKGDANEFVDALRPTHDEVIGRSVAIVPKGGRFLGLLPLLAASASVLYWVLSGSRAASPDAPATGGWRAGRPPIAVAGLGLIVIGLGVGLVAMIATQERLFTREIPFDTSVSMAWRAEAPPSVVYPTGRLSVTDPIFLSEIDQVDVAVDVTGPAAATEMAGQVSLTATLADGSGWTTEAVLVSRAPIRNGKAKLASSLNLGDIADLLDEVGRRTGFVPSSHDLTLTVEGEIAGNVGGQSFEQPVTHQVDLVLDDLRLAPDPSQQWTVALPGTVTVDQATQRSVEAGPISLPLGMTRMLALTLVVVGSALMVWNRRSDMEEHEFINQCFAGFVMPATTIALPSEASLVDVTDFEDLLRIAQIEGSPILELEGAELDQAHQWLTVSLGVWYRYRILSAQLADAEPIEVGVPLSAPAH